MGKKKNNIDIVKVANKVKKGNAELLQQRNVQQALDEYGKELNHKDKRLSTRKKLIILFSTIIGVAVLSVVIFILLNKKETHIYPFLDYNIDQMQDDSVKMKKGSTVNDLRVTDVPGYRFDGWYADSKFTSLLSADSSLQDKVTIYGRYIRVYNVSLTIDNVTYNVHYDEGITLNEILEKENLDITDYNSCGWFSDANTTIPFNGTLIEDLQIYTKRATLDKIDFTSQDNGYIVTLKENVNLENSGNLVIPKCYDNANVVGFNLQDCNIANLTIPSTITEIASNSMNNSTIGSINLTANLTTIHDYAFENTNIPFISIPNTVTNIGVGAFKNSGLQEININNSSLISLSSEMFAGCKNLVELDLNNCPNLETIEATSLDGCISLNKIVIPNKTTNIDFNTFKTCINLSIINIDENHPIYDSRENCNGIVAKVDIIKETEEIEVSDNTEDFEEINDIILKDTLLLGCKGTTIPSSVKIIATSAFNNYLGLTSLFVPENVETIENYAFENCANLTTITITNSTPGEGCFKNCLQLNNINLPSTLTEFNSNLFEGCSSLKSINIPQSVITIKNNVFSFSGLKAIHIPKNVENIDINAFNRCDDLQFITIDERNSKFDSRDNANAIIETSTSILYIGCSNTTIPISVVTIGNSAFKDCINLTQIKIPSSITTIDISAFEGCTGLTFLELPIEVNKIGKNAFKGCSNLANVSIPSTTTKVIYYTHPVTGELIMKTETLNETGDWHVVQSVTDWSNREGGEKLDVKDNTLNANMLTNTHFDLYWYKTEKQTSSTSLFF